MLTCRDCGRTASVAGEMPEEYTACFREVIARDGWVIAPGHRAALLCGRCLGSYVGSESRDDGEKIRGAG